MSAHEPDIGAVPAGAASGGGGAAHGDTLPPEDLRERPLPELVKQLTDQSTTLVKQEIELAKTEAKAEAAKAGKGAGLLGGAGATGYLTLVFLSLALMFMLDSWMHTGWAALIVAVLWGIAAAVMAMKGRKELKAMNPTLETTQRTIKEDVAWAKEQKNK